MQNKFTQRNAEDRNFLHELATPMTKLRIVLKRFEKLEIKPENLEPAGDVKTLVNHMLGYLQQIEDTHAHFKSTIFQRESDDGDTLENSRET